MECAGNPCQNGGTCDYQGEGQYTCPCSQGYSGDHCEKGEKLKSPGRMRWEDLKMVIDSQAYIFTLTVRCSGKRNFKQNLKYLKHQ